MTTSPSLEAFFAAMGRFLGEHPHDPGPLLAAFPGWEPDPERLAIYGRFAQGAVQGALDALFPACRASLPAERWAALARTWHARRPATHWELDRIGHGFAELLAEAADLPPWLAPLAHLEWAKVVVYSSRLELPSTPPAVLQPNPTLQALAHPWRLCAYALACRADPPPAGPEPGEEIALVWRCPTTRLARSRPADARALLALKLASEGIAPERAAAEAAVPLAEVRAAIADAAEAGLVLGPSV